MLKRNWRHLLLILILILVGAVLLLWSRPAPTAKLDHLQLPDGSFEIEVQGWLGKAGQEAATGPELARLPAAKVLCAFGKDEATDSGCTQEGAVGEKLELPGGHHYDENYPALAAKLLQAVEKRQGGQQKD
ncbi:Bacterial virulence protein (VirJ) [compost metagenome]